jgi:hypothetical protein
MSNIGLKPNSLLFSVVTDVDANRNLFLDNATHTLVHCSGKLRSVDKFSLFTPDQQIRQLVSARKAAHMSRKDSIPACNHQLILQILRDGDRIRFELEVQVSVSVPQFLLRRRSTVADTVSNAV